MKTDKACLQDILAAMRSAMTFVGDRTLEQFIADDLVSAGVERRIEIMGEATKRLSMSLREAHPEIPWSKMAGMRDLLIHAYDDIELEVVYNAVTQVIPPLIPKIEAIVRALPDPE
jgi:uncharacterized protein with HEPN domain